MVYFFGEGFVAVRLMRTGRKAGELELLATRYLQERAG